MFDLIKGINVSRYVIAEVLLSPHYQLFELIEIAGLLRFAPFVHHFEEMMDVHALVNVQEECSLFSVT